MGCWAYLLVGDSFSIILGLWVVAKLERYLKGSSLKLRGEANGVLVDFSFLVLWKVDEAIDGGEIVSFDY